MIHTSLAALTRRWRSRAASAAYGAEAKQIIKTIKMLLYMKQYVKHTPVVSEAFSAPFWLFHLLLLSWWLCPWVVVASRLHEADGSVLLLDTVCHK